MPTTLPDRPTATQRQITALLDSAARLWLAEHPDDRVVVAGLVFAGVAGEALAVAASRAKGVRCSNDAECPLHGPDADACLLAQIVGLT